MQTSESYASSLEVTPQKTARTHAMAMRLAFLIAVAVYAILLSVMWSANLQQTGGHFVYPLDDTYITMSMSRNLAEHGVYGFTRHDFTFASSTPLDILLTAAIFKLVGTNIFVPFCINVIGALGILWSVTRIFKQLGVSALFTGAVLLALIFFVPLVPLTFAGMEHLVHAWITIEFAWLSLHYLHEDTRGTLVPVLLLAPLLGTIRYEGLFTVAAVCLLLLFSGRIAGALLTATAGLLPMATFGTYATHRGWFFLPNSLMMKAGLPGGRALALTGAPLFRAAASFVLVSLLVALAVAAFRSSRPAFAKASTAGVTLIAGIVLQMSGFPWLTMAGNIAMRLGAFPGDSLEVFSLAVAAIVLLVVRPVSRKTKSLLFLFFFTAILHQELATYGWFFRYEAYMVAFGIFAIAIAIWELQPALRLKSVLAIALATTALNIAGYPLLLRASQSLTQLPKVENDFYRQQYQMAQFFRRYYPNANIGLNDIGAVNFYTDLHCSDMWGLADIEVLRMRRENRYNPEALASLLSQRGVQVIAIYDTWFALDRNPAPKDWIRVEQWRLNQITQLGGYAISFYGVGPENAARLQQNLEDFDHQLPAGIAVYRFRPTDSAPKQ